MGNAEALRQRIRTFCKIEKLSVCHKIVALSLSAL